MDENPTTEELKLAEAKGEGESWGKLSLLRHKLSEKARAEPKFLFYALYDRIYRKDVLLAALDKVRANVVAFVVDGLIIEAIEKSVEKTGRCLIAQEAPRTSGFAAELSALVQERCFYHLEAPVERVTGWDTPYPHAYEWAYFPGPKRMKKALEKVMAD